MAPLTSIRLHTKSNFESVCHRPFMLTKDSPSCSTPDDSGVALGVTWEAGAYFGEVDVSGVTFSSAAFAIYTTSPASSCPDDFERWEYVDVRIAEQLSPAASLSPRRKFDAVSMETQEDRCALEASLCGASSDVSALETCLADRPSDCVYRVTANLEVAFSDRCGGDTATIWLGDLQSPAPGFESRSVLEATLVSSRLLVPFLDIQGICDVTLQMLNEDCSVAFDIAPYGAGFFSDGAGFTLETMTMGAGLGVVSNSGCSSRPEFAYFKDLQMEYRLTGLKERPTSAPQAVSVLDSEPDCVVDPSELERCVRANTQPTPESLERCIRSIPPECLVQISISTQGSSNRPETLCASSDTPPTLGFSLATELMTMPEFPSGWIYPAKAVSVSGVCNLLLEETGTDSCAGELYAGEVEMCGLDSGDTETGVAISSQETSFRLEDLAAWDARWLKLVPDSAAVSCGSALRMIDLSAETRVSVSGARRSPAFALETLTAETPDRAQCAAPQCSDVASLEDCRDASADDCDFHVSGRVSGESTQPAVLCIDGLAADLSFVQTLPRTSDAGEFLSASGVLNLRLFGAEDANCELAAWLVPELDCANPTQLEGAIALPSPSPPRQGEVSVTIPPETPLTPDMARPGVVLAPTDTNMACGAYLDAVSFPDPASRAESFDVFSLVTGRVPPFEDSLTKEYRSVSPLTSVDSCHNLPAECSPSSLNTAGLWECLCQLPMACKYRSLVWLNGDSSDGLCAGYLRVPSHDAFNRLDELNGTISFSLARASTEVCDVELFAGRRSCEPKVTGAEPLAALTLLNGKKELILDLASVTPSLLAAPAASTGLPHFVFETVPEAASCGLSIVNVGYAVQGIEILSGMKELCDLPTPAADPKTTQATTPSSSSADPKSLGVSLLLAATLLFLS
eukprot:Gregarina_sp_Pseudo_9__2196@NODE_253_length_3414_cov_6_899852_g236_i0_p1_GENE_NODE_253_length_3414_cov_6_899852_g236_i0NODE_253_length_3414_cov_6_899852_g236_i0_p1_ORF_typecomplete_len932_score272_01_NODE_253_length_3414_cov_6_899852_g236_i06183356